MNLFYILALMILAGFSSAVTAFEIVHLDYSHSGKELFYFVFDGGTKDGVKDGMTACAHGEDDEELFCGPVVATTDTKAGVYAPANLEAWLDVGYFVRIDELGDVPGNKKNWRGLLSEANTATSSSLREPRRGGLTWQTNYVMTPLLPFKYNHADFSIDSRMSGNGSLWKGSVPVKSSLVGLSAGVRAPLSRNLDHEVALVWRYISPIQKEVDYDPNSGDVYAKQTSKLSDVSLAWDVKSLAPKSGFSLGWQAGVAYDQVNFDYTATVQDDSGGTQSGTLASSKAVLNEVSAKAGARIERGFGSNGTQGSKGLSGLSVNILSPIYAKTAWSHGDHTMPVDAVQGAASKQDLEEATQFGKATVGVEANIYLGWMF